MFEPPKNMSHLATEKVILQIEGLHCASCVQAVEKSLKGTAGVDETKVNLATEKAIAQFNPAAVEKAGLIVIAETAMASSSITVVSNANLLKRLRL